MDKIPPALAPVIVVNAPLPAVPPDEAATFLLPDQMRWQRLVPSMGDASPKMTVVHHDPGTLATAMLIWTPPGFHVPPHWHSGNERHMVVRGTFIIECDGKKVAMTAGTFNYLPARTIHQAWTPADSDCLLYTAVDTLWDVNWLGKPAGL